MSNYSVDSGNGANHVIPPYPAGKTFWNFIAKLKESIPSRIDRSVMRGQSGAAQATILGALRYLGLIQEDGHPTDKLTRLVHSEGTERQAVIADILKSSYSFVFGDGFDLATASPAQLSERFKSTRATGDTVRKCINFFMSLAENGGLTISPHIKKGAATSATQRRPRKTTGKAKAPAQTATQAEASHSGHPQQDAPAKSIGWEQLLLSKFPTFDPQWTDEVKKSWFEAFHKLMDKGPQRVPDGK